MTPHTGKLILAVVAFAAINVGIAVYFSSPPKRDPGDISRYLEPEFWRHQALTEIIPFWEQTKDPKNGGFFSSVMIDGTVDQKKGKFPRMISRIAYGYSVAYLLSGDDHYLELAQYALDYLFKYGWDEKNSGWILYRDRHNVTSPYYQKNLFDQTYGNLGPVMYYFTTHDKSMLPYVEKTHSLIQTKAWDPVNKGYYAEMGPEWTRTVSTKSFNSQIDTCTAYLIYYYMATKDTKLLTDFSRIADFTATKMIDPATGFVGETFTDDWKSIENMLWVGHNLKTGWVLLRAYYLTGEKSYLAMAERIAQTQMKLNWDSRYWGWKFHFHAKKPSFTDDGKDWWTQTEGNFLMLNLYHLTGKKEYLENFMQCAYFWDTFIIDHKNLECFAWVSPNGADARMQKADLYKAMYHTMEHSLMNYLNLSFYVKKQDAPLYFNLSSDYDGERHYVKIIEDPSVVLKKVEIDGKEWMRFDSKECCIFMPKGQKMKVKVWLGV
ncbi:MAG TPA: AGE family epimerase/isomerase [Spirochaetota bacterium]